MTAAAETTAPPRLNVIGAGRLGRTLARLWRAAGLVSVAAVYCRDPAHALTARTFIGAGDLCCDPRQAAPAEFTLIAVPDDVIATLAETIAGGIGAGQVVFHCSGVHSSRLLAPLAARGARVASAHPLHSFSEPERSLACFAGSFCTLEGDAAAVAELARLFAGIGATTTVIAAAAKPLYHAAAAMASNHLVTLLDASIALLGAAGIAPLAGVAMLAPLVRQTADNALADRPGDALTGPIARGDTRTVAEHLRAIHGQCPSALPLYRALGLATLAMAERRSGWNTDAGARLRALLTNPAPP